jgi:hypothetical protein
VIVTEWEQFRALDFDRLRDVMAAPVMIDLRNVYHPEDVTSRGFLYFSIGRPQTDAFQSNSTSAFTESPTLTAAFDGDAAEVPAETRNLDLIKRREAAPRSSSPLITSSNRR